MDQFSNDSLQAVPEWAQTAQESQNIVWHQGQSELSSLPLTMPVSSAIPKHTCRRSKPGSSSVVVQLRAVRFRCRGVRPVGNLSSDFA